MSSYLVRGGAALGRRPSEPCPCRAPPEYGKHFAAVALLLLLLFGLFFLFLVLFFVLLEHLFHGLLDRLPGRPVCIAVRLRATVLLVLALPLFFVAVLVPDKWKKIGMIRSSKKGGVSFPLFTSQ